ncbi:SDR family oxidoreductase [Imhoffiella purpurea]|uniref:Oxidoreductase, short-chain dehydrogenase/reductase family n=1 Tax=Imhoffiella purpurea TaxID=1249627 RepID=W9VP63_9GAMM|nr:SDR family oxidoreductase [Imhoffiella purpurea]EXJ12265.1 oxidoreductase, short-chain dehydrogenase/reductase family [Imhoffiella purpurea]
MKRILIIGATSAIATACARAWAEQGAHFFLVARNPHTLSQTATDLSARGAAACHTYELDVTRIDDHPAMLSSCLDTLTEIDIALIAHGTLPDQTACEGDAPLAVEEFNLNATATIALLTILATRLEHQKSGTLAVITSVAGDRGRPSNYVYGSAKAAVSTFCEGMRARLFKSGVHLIDIRPGFVATPMTQGLPLPALLVAQADSVAKRILNGIEHRTDVLYAPGFWAWIMLIIRTIPRPVFKRLSL